MTKKEIIDLKNCTLFDKIMYNIQYLSCYGCTCWTGFVIENTSEIIKKFEQLGFTVTKSKVSCLLITISWNE